MTCTKTGTGLARTLGRRAAALSLAAPLALAAACGGDRDRDVPRVPEGTPVVIVSVDTLRSDRLPMYGYGAVETPALDAFRDDAILFEHAYAHVPLTLPSHVSLLSGLLPPEHGVRDNLGYEARPESHAWLPRILREEGYRTGAAVSSFVLRASTGFASGFDFYEDDILQRSWQIGESQRTGDKTLAASREWLRSVHREPFFFLFHIYEPHQPLTPPEPFASRYEDPYDGEVASADAIVGELFAELRELGVYDRALIVFLSDHGEGLGDHGLTEHGPFLYREQIQVPLVVKLPGGELAGTSVAAPAQLVDLAPTILGLLGLELPGPLPGSSLVALATAAEPAPRTIFGETLYPRVQFGWSELSSAIQYPYHLIQGPDPELYDLAADPGETRNVLRDERRRYASLRDALEDYDGEYRPPSRVEDPEVRARLAALGYLGGGGPGTESLADPKSKLGVLEALADAVRQGQTGRPERAVELYRRILEEEPGMTTAWEYLGNNLLRLGRNEEALDAYRRQMELSQGSSVAALNVAGALLRLGRLEEAEEHALLAAEDYPQAWDTLAQIALRQEDVAKAEGYLEHAASDSAQPGLRVTRAEVLVAQGRPEEALEVVAEVEETVRREGLDPELARGLYVIRGEALASLGRGEEAAAAFRREIELFPHELSAYSRLALLYALVGEGQSSAQILRRMVPRGGGRGSRRAGRSAGLRATQDGAVGPALAGGGEEALGRRRIAQ
ncbi:MAG TPA: sulfatase-like hydrolase/transferase, partial [Thermoanaerobaculia bacterium]|nr:sulfatase-like hydrolase/transferase [Thermoanaerobaculia bacterium]